MEGNAQSEKLIIASILGVVGILLLSNVHPLAVAQNQEYDSSMQMQQEVDTIPITHQDDQITNQQGVQQMQQQPTPSPAQFTVCNNPRLVSQQLSIYSSFSKVSSPQTMSGGSREYFLPLLKFPPITNLVAYSLGANGRVDTDDRGIINIQNRVGGLDIYSNFPSAFGNRVAYTLTSQGSPVLFIKYGGPDGLFATGDEVSSIVMGPQGTWQLAGYYVDFNLVANGIVYIVNDSVSGATYVVRQSEGNDNLLQSPFIYRTSDDVLEIANPSFSPTAENPRFPYTSLSKVTTWRATQPGGSNQVTWLVSPEDGILGNANDNRYYFGGNGLHEEGLVSYDARWLLTRANYNSPTTDSVNLYDLRPNGLQGPQGMNGPAGRIPTTPTPQNFPLVIPQGTVSGPLVTSLDVDGRFTDPQGRTIDGAVTIGYLITVNIGGRLTQYTVILYNNPGPDNQFFNTDDLIKYYVSSGPVDFIWGIGVKEQFVTFAGAFQGRTGIFHMCVA